VVGEEPPRPPDASQLALFGRADHPVLSELASLDPNTLSPLEALTRLAELKRRAEES
jgi:hypothetical protein